MRKTTLLLLSLALTTFVAFAQGNPHQARIDAAFGQSFATQQNQLERIVQELKQDESKPTYWAAYALFHSGIFYQQSGQSEKAAAAIQEAIALLREKENKSSEDHALLGYITGFSISLDPSAAGRLSAKAAGEYREALKKNPENMRAYVGMATSDFNTPVSFGGGQKTEEYLLKALSLPEQLEEKGPSWGKNQAYFILASFYVREGETDKAKMYCMQGLSQFPHDFQLNQLKQSL